MKDEKHWAKFGSEGRYWTHAEADVHAAAPIHEYGYHHNPHFVAHEPVIHEPVVHETVVHEPVVHHARYVSDDDDSDGEYRHIRRSHAHDEDFLAFRHVKYDQALPEKQRDVDERQMDADERFAEFRVKHPYMSEEELQLYHKKYEVEPFFHSRAEKEAWKHQKKEQKLMREERRRILKHEREMRELTEAYETMMDPTYEGDSDVEHVVEERRQHVYHRYDEPLHHEERVVHHAPVVHERRVVDVYEPPVVHEVVHSVPIHE
jgi:hypothetical protein|mmetsp:Transcript_7162/g.9993  ORF Transcript_7162/g.9993 Transcript_7162/m.9993 type:complete len:262 (-) Transcript_7162:883-1668(-)